MRGGEGGGGASAVVVGGVMTVGPAADADSLADADGAVDGRYERAIAAAAPLSSRPAPRQGEALRAAGGTPPSAGSCVDRSHATTGPAPTTAARVPATTTRASCALGVGGRASLARVESLTIVSLLRNASRRASLPCGSAGPRARAAIASIARRHANVTRGDAARFETGE